MLRASLSVVIKKRWLTIDVVNFKKSFFLKDNYSIWNFVIAFTKFPGLPVTLAQTTTKITIFDNYISALLWLLCPIGKLHGRWV